MSRVYCACFMGQFGYLFSPGIPRTASRLRNIGCRADVYGYKDVAAARNQLTVYRNLGFKTVGIGYSLGCTSVTYLQTQIPFDLVMCLAESELAGPNNHPINHHLTKRSVLWHGPDFLSSAGLKDGFDAVHQIDAIHLWIDLSPEVSENILFEVGKLTK